MATTNLIVDFLVVGVTSFIWIAPILFFVQGDKWLSVFSNSGIVLGLIVLGFVYILGISLSRLADDLLDRFNDRWRDEVFGKNAKPSYHNKLNLIITKSDGAADYLSYRRSIIRITRACSLNFLFGAIAWVLVEWLKPIQLSKGGATIIAVFSAVIFLLLIRALPVVLKGYFNTIKDIYEYIKKEK
jgi:hypothetical protein